jgi:hypothetical protein
VLSGKASLICGASAPSLNCDLAAGPSEHFVTGNNWHMHILTAAIVESSRCSVSFTRNDCVKPLLRP